VVIATKSLRILISQALEELKYIHLVEALYKFLEAKKVFERAELAVEISHRAWLKSRMTILGGKKGRLGILFHFVLLCLKPFELASVGVELYIAVESLVAP
jgi:propanediol dehydratase large subunit